MKFGLKIVDKSSTYNKKRLTNYAAYHERLDGSELAIYNNSGDYIKNIEYYIFHAEFKKFNSDKLLNEREEMDKYIEAKLLPILKKEKI